MANHTVAVIGLGIIGSIWARHYQQAGILTAAWNRSPKPELKLPINELKDCAQHAQALHICVYDANSVDSVLQQLLPYLNERHIVIQSSTIDGASAKRFAAKVRETGADYLEAPFTGSKPAAEARQTIFFLGGDAAAVTTAEPFLKHLSAKRYHIGRYEQATTIKLAMNLQIAGIAESLCEAISLSRSAQIDDARFFEVMKDNVAWSGLSAMKEAKLRTADFSPQFSIKNLHKDMRLAQLTADKPLPVLDQVVESLNAAKNAGYGDEDFIALIRTL